MTETKFDPIRDIGNLRDSVSRAIEQGISNISGALQIRLDMYELENQLVIQTAPIDGIVPSSIDINVENDILTLSGKTEPDEAPKNASYVVHERRFGEFSRSVRLPYAVAINQAQAKLGKNGTLTISLPVEEGSYHNINVTPVE